MLLGNAFECGLFDGSDASLVHSCNFLVRSVQHSVERMLYCLCCGLYNIYKLWMHGLDVGGLLFGRLAS